MTDRTVIIIPARYASTRFEGKPLAEGIAGLFLEAHPDPDQALCDGPSALPLDLIKPFLMQMKAVDDLVKSLPALAIE